MSSVHKTCINQISISGQQMITSSQSDRSCIWDLNTLQLLKRLTDLTLSQTIFLSMDRIIASFRNHLIHVYDSNTFEVIQTLKQRQLISAQKNSFTTRNIANNGCLEINYINDENNLMTKTVELIDGLESNSIKQLFSCDNNRILIYLTIDGLLKCKYSSFESTRFTTITVSNELMTGITSNGELHVFDLKHLNTVRLKKVVLKQRKEEVFDDNQEVVRKLSLTLLEKYHKFPQKYRYFIWSKLLSLPLNRDSFKRIESQSNFYNKELDNALRQLQERHNLIDDSLRHALKRTISQLIYWRPKLLKNIEDLALFSFPFIKLFRRNQLILFETLATLIDNNYFFDNELKEYSEMFELVSTLLKRECFKLESHFNSLKVKTSHYCLPLIISVFSEVFLRNDWLIISDHIMTYGPKIYIYLVVSYCHLSQQSLLRMQKIDEICNYFRAQNSMPVNKVIQFAHQLSQKYVSLIPFTIKCLPKNVYN